MERNCNGHNTGFALGGLTDGTHHSYFLLTLARVLTVGQLIPPERKASERYASAKKKLLNEENNLHRYGQCSR